MELPARPAGDILLRPGQFTDLRARLRKLASKHDLTTVIACAFDARTRILPFVYSSLRMAPAGVRSIGSALAEAGFDKTRIVLQQWNPNFRPSRMRLDGKIPDMFLVSSMRIHARQCEALIRDACRIPPAERPLIVAGGPKVIYEPWTVFGSDPGDPWGADLAVTGEEYVLLELMEALLSCRAGNEPMRSAFFRARDSGALDEIPGLVYPRGDRNGVPEELVDTGIQRLLGDLDELPQPVLGYRLLEAPSREPALASKPLSAERVAKLSRIGSLVLTLGCKFRCPYCGIPAYNQRQYRTKSGARIAEEMTRLHSEYGMQYFFGADDNFFNDTSRTLDIVETLAKAQVNGRPFRKKIRWGTEVTVHDTLRMGDRLRTVRKAGVRALWLGVEDMTAALINKGQTPDNTLEAFRLLQARGIAPIAMLMHHDQQPLYTRGTPYGLLNQLKLLRQAGAVDMQALMLTPAPGSRSFEETYTSGLVYDSVGGKRTEPYMFDGNYVVASEHPKPWRKQFNIMAAYLYFYNPLQFLDAIIRPKAGLYLADVAIQVTGMLGLTKTFRRTLPWALRLLFGRIRRTDQIPTSPIPIRSATGGRASHALSEEQLPTPQQARASVPSPSR